MKLDSIKQDSQREKFLLMLFPSALILAVYSVMFAVPLRAEKNLIELEYNREKALAISEESAKVAQQNLNSEKEGLERIRKRVSNSRQQIRELSVGWRSGNTRLETLEKITELMRDYNLSIVSQGGEDTVIVSTYLQELFEMFNEQSVQEPVELWPVEIKGGYFDVLEFLTDVNLYAKSIIPVSITMQPDTLESSQRMWTIVFVI
ncbi:MAG: hypothetical protein AAF623_19855 [Planctomycetota bacterium]